VFRGSFSSRQSHECKLKNDISYLLITDQSHDCGMTGEEHSFASVQLEQKVAVHVVLIESNQLLHLDCEMAFASAG
jgi:hypothetical protein